MDQIYIIIIGKMAKDFFSSWGHAWFYIPLSITIHDCNTIALNRILLDTHLVLAGITQTTIVNGRQVKREVKHRDVLHWPPSRLIRWSIMKQLIYTRLTFTKVIATGQSQWPPLLVITYSSSINVETLNIVSESTGTSACMRYLCSLPQIVSSSDL